MFCFVFCLAELCPPCHAPTAMIRLFESLRLLERIPLSKRRHLASLRECKYIRSPSKLNP